MSGIRCQLARLSIALLCALFAIIILLSRTVFLDGFKEAEEQQMVNDLMRTTDAITFRLYELDRTAVDWSAWNDTYRFVHDRNQNYISSNLPDKAVAGIELNCVLFLDNSGKTVFSKWISLETQKELPGPAGLAAALEPVKALLKNRPVSEGVRGIVMLPDGPLMVAARPIITSAFSGPVRGIFIAGRRLDNALIDHIKNQTHLDVALHIGTNGLTSQKKLQIVRLDEYEIKGEQLVSDILGTPVLTLQVNGRRDIYQLGKKTSVRITLALLFSGVCIAGVLFIYGEKGIVRHLTRMSRQADEIAKSGDINQRIQIGGAPELQRLAHAVNNMLTSLEEAQRELQESELKHRVVLQQSSDAILLFDTELQRIIDANNSFFAITGFRPGESSFLTPVRFLVAADKLPALIRIARQRQQLSLEGVLCRNCSGNILEMDISVSLITLHGRELLSAIMRDVTKRNQEQRQIHELAITDTLTGLANRRHLFGRGEQEFERLKRNKDFQPETCTLGCIMLDIDHFKCINDSHGHQAGDAVLKEVARRILTCVRPYDVAGRYGGEEFCILIINTSCAQTVLVAERIWQGIRSAAFYCGSSSFPVSASLGISCATSVEDTIDDLLQHADAALYRAKQAGRDTIVVAENCGKQPGSDCN